MTADPRLRIAPSTNSPILIRRPATTAAPSNRVLSVNIKQISLQQRTGFIGQSGSHILLRVGLPRCPVRTIPTSACQADCSLGTRAISPFRACFFPRGAEQTITTVGCVLLFLLVAHAILYVPGCPACALADKSAPPPHSASGTLVASRIAVP
ncbi:hypothetical protein BKA83DRAFT_3156531 [Pisolithus microcarpus]|nr:hypothetical protein BKA83DRAFT_3156531 [Pisolithus microcarpus]